MVFSNLKVKFIVKEVLTFWNIRSDVIVINSQLFLLSAVKVKAKQARVAKNKCLFVDFYNKTCDQEQEEKRLQVEET